MNPNNAVGRLDCYEPVVVARGLTAVEGGCHEISDRIADVLAGEASATAITEVITLQKANATTYRPNAKRPAPSPSTL